MFDSNSEQFGPEKWVGAFRQGVSLRAEGLRNGRKHYCRFSIFEAFFSYIVLELKLEYRKTLPDTYCYRTYVGIPNTALERNTGTDCCFRPRIGLPVPSTVLELTIISVMISCRSQGGIPVPTAVLELMLEHSVTEYCAETARWNIGAKYCSRTHAEIVTGTELCGRTEVGIPLLNTVLQTTFARRYRMTYYGVP